MRWRSCAVYSASTAVQSGSVKMRRGMKKAPERRKRVATSAMLRKSCPAAMCGRRRSKANITCGRAARVRLQGRGAAAGEEGRVQ